MWYQRSRLNWFQSGDRNTRFFHARASSRYKKNVIIGLLDSHGVWQEEKHKIGEVVVGYFADHFSSNRPTEFIEILNAVQPKVSDNMNRMLNMPFQLRKCFQL